MEESR